MPGRSRPRPLRRGNRIAEEWVRPVGDGIVQRAATSHGEVMKYGTSLVISSPKAPQAGVVRQFYYWGMETDWLICNTWDGSSVGTGEFYIAKPYLLRTTPFAGSSRAGINYTYVDDETRTADDGALPIPAEEDQVIVPAYVTGDTIYAIFGVVGGTEVVREGTPVKWLDLNVDGRAWARVAV